MTLNDLKARAQKLGITAADISAHYGSLKKDCWQQAIADAERAQMDAALAAEAEEENNRAAVARAYQSPAAPVVFGVVMVNALARVLLPPKKK